MYEDLCKALRESLPPQIDYAELVCAEGFAHGQHFVWNDPLPYIIEQAANAIESLETKLAHVTKIRDDYATAAREIKLWLKDFCDEALPYDQMIANAARKAAQKIEALETELNRRTDENRWIPCSERLPDNDETVEACIFAVEAYNSFEVFDARYRNGTDAWFTRGKEINVTHWRIPSPPEGARE